MSTDTEIQRLLDEITVPDHGPGFWEAVRDDLAHDAPGDGLVRLDEVRITRPGLRPWVVAAAAVAVLVGGVAVLLAGRDDAPIDVTSDPPEQSPTGPTIPEPADEGALRPDGAPSRGTGLVVAISPDGEWLYVADTDPTGGRGCEGAPRRTLFVQPADGSGEGERRLAVDRSIDATGGTRLDFGPDGSVAVRTFCELSATSVGTGVIRSDGTIVDYSVLDDGDSGFIVDLEWARSGVVVLSTYGLGSDDAVADAAGRRLFEVDVESGERTPLEANGIMYLEVATDGQLITRDNVGTVRFGDEVLGSEGGVHDLVASNDGRFVVTAGDKGVTVYDRETGEHERIYERPAFNLRYLESGDVVFTTRDDEPVGRVMAVRLGAVGSGEHATSTLFSDAGLGHLTHTEVAPDGSHLWVCYLTDPDDTTAVLESQPLTR